MRTGYEHYLIVVNHFVDDVLVDHGIGGFGRGEGRDCSRGRLWPKRDCWRIGASEVSPSTGRGRTHGE